VKVRAYFRYKGIPHEWIPRTADRMEEYQRYAKLPLIPCVVAPDETAMQDSTPIIEKLEAQFPDPSIIPGDAAAAFISALIEEYADEWVNKPMFHYRWSCEADKKATADWIARETLPDADDADRKGLKDMLLDRMPGRLNFVGSSPETADQLEWSYKRLLRYLNDHLLNREYLFGGRPALADFGIWAELYELSIDPTPGKIMRSGFPNVMEYVERMAFPEAIGEFEPLGDLMPTLGPLLEDEVAGLFLPWSDANAKALAAGKESFTVTLQGKHFTQQAQKYHAKSLQVLRERYAAVADKSDLDPLLERTGCLTWLKG
jgi:glutathione S-transferase